MSKTIRTSNHLTIDAVGDIILDADNADVKLQDGGTEFGRISRVTSDLVIKSMGDNNDILFKGLDASTTITALQLDMSEGGNAIFSGNITATDITANSLTTNVISSNGSNADISIQPSGTGDVLLGAIRVNGTTLDSSDSTAININEALVVDGTGNFSGTLTTAALTTSGTLTVTGQADIEGVTIVDNEIKASRSNDALVLSTAGTGKVTASGGLIVTGGDTETADISSSGEIGAVGFTATGSSTFDGITINDNVVSTSSNADLNLSPGGTGAVVASGIRVVGTTLSADDSSTININEGLVVDGTTNVTGTLTANGLINGVQTLTGSGSTEVVSLTETVTQLITTGTQNFSLANGTEGQIKIITLKTDGGNATVTPASFLNGTSITFDDVGDTMTMLYQSTGWIVLAQQNTTVNA
tara:strand:+ start:447 stop:1691 length:1245 start_codon:yes stop_codon:yes gene_type:complete